jgi:hypothetical protein
LLVDPRRDDDAWAVFATQPIRPVPRLTPGLTHDEVAQIVEHALSGSAHLRTGQDAVVKVLGHLSEQRHNSRVGLRSWVISNVVASAGRTLQCGRLTCSSGTTAL